MKKTKKKYVKSSKKGPVQIENSKYHNIRNMFESIGRNEVAEKVTKEKGEVAKKVVKIEEKIELLVNNCKQVTTGSSDQKVKRLDKSFRNKQKKCLHSKGESEKKKLRDIKKQIQDK